MRFIHTGDIHLGATPESKRPWAANRGDEIWNTLERLIKKIKIANYTPSWLLNKPRGSFFIIVFLFLLCYDRRNGKIMGIRIGPVYPVKKPLSLSP